MTDTNFPLSGSDIDDLPRTLRREHEARAREARERAGSGLSATAYAAPETAHEGAGSLSDAPLPATVRDFDVPFLSLVTFFLKAVLAAIPALLLLTVILWFFGQALQSLFPELVKMKILISFPNG